MKRITTFAAALLLGVLVAPASHAATTVQGGPLTGLSPNSVTQVHLAFSGYPTTHGLYVEEAVQGVAGARPTTAGPALWVSAQAGDISQGATPITGDVVLKVDNGHSWGADCLHQQCGIFIRLDHTAPKDTSEDKFLPLAFIGATPATPPAPALPADTLSVKINGKVAVANTPITVQYRTPISFSVLTGSGVKATLHSYTPELCPVIGKRVDILKGSGECDIAVTAPGNTTLSSATVHFQLVLSPATQQVSSHKVPVKVSRSRNLDSVTRFGEKITYTALNNKCIVRGSTVIGVNAGTCTISATAPGTANYTALSQTFSVVIFK